MENKEAYFSNPAVRSLADEMEYSRTLLCLDILKCRFLYGMSTSFYLTIGFYKMNHAERVRVLTSRKRDRILKKMNTSKEWKSILDNKALFNQRMSAFIHRKWLYAGESSEEQVKGFLNCFDQVIVKPAHGEKGKNVYVVSCETALREFDSFYRQILKDDAILEELIVQHEAVKALNPTSVNTIRIATARDPQGEVHIIGASLRVGGKGAVVDNLHASGVQYPIDPGSGTVIGGGVNYAGQRDIYYHPSTNCKVIGFVIPGWEQILAFVQRAAAIPEGLRYIGWDIAITPDGCDLVEANATQGCNGIQLDGKGKYYLLKKYV
ncbi:MAG: hypothetical protein LUE92_13265 [Clostridiales bacterium]|nr:hypothetical protein [Clostridiales bacterium]